MSKNIYVGNLPFDTTTDDLQNWFAEHGTVTRAQVATDRDTGRSRGFGFVEMSQGADEAMAALDGSQVGDRTLKVNEAKPREDRPRASGSVAHTVPLVGSAAPPCTAGSVSSQSSTLSRWPSASRSRPDARSSAPSQFPSMPS